MKQAVTVAAALFYNAIVTGSCVAAAAACAIAGHPWWAGAFCAGAVFCGVTVCTSKEGQK